VTERLTEPLIDEHDTFPPSEAVTARPRPTCLCGHKSAAHDRIALRYCQATASSELRRTCICNVAAALPMSRR
jgi:hypothetical protein